MRTMIVVLMAIGLGLNGWTANAQEDSRHALAEELLNEMNMKETVEKSFEMVKKMIPSQMAQMRPAMEKTDTSPSTTKPTDKAMDKMMDMVTQELSWETMKEDYITIYAETFTEEELQGAIAFYKSPAGKAFTKKQPALMEQSMRLSQKRMLQIMPKIQAMTKELMKEAAPQLKEPARQPKMAVPPQPATPPKPEELRKEGK